MKMKFARVGKAAHVFGMDSGTGAVSDVSLCGEKRRLTGNVYDRPLAKTKLCGVCMEKGMKLAEKGDEERAKAQAKKPLTDLDKHGVYLNDIWETEKGTKFEVIRVEGRLVEVRSEHGPHPSTYQCPLSPAVFHKRLWAVGCGRQRPKPVIRTEPPQVPGSDGPKEGDTWLAQDGNWLKILEVKGSFVKTADESGMVAWRKEKELRKLEGRPGVLLPGVIVPEPKAKPETAPPDLDYPQDPLERLAERDYDRIKAEEAKSLGRAKAAEAKPAAQAGVLDGDIWAMDDDGTKFMVIRVHQSAAFCQFLGSPAHFIAGLADGHFFDKLLERNGRPYQAKRSQPQRGMDLATYGIHKGDKWQALNGNVFRVVVPTDDGKGRIDSVVIEWTKPACDQLQRETLSEVYTNTFHYLMERDGKNMEEN